MPSDSTVDEELRVLRSRAYGPDADIHEDPGAIQRLHELEALRNVKEPFPDDATLITSGNSEPRDEVSSLIGDGGHSEPDPAADHPLPAEDGEVVRRASFVRTERRRVLFWAISMTASAALAATITFAFAWMSPVSASSGAPQIASLQPASFVEIPPGWFGAQPDSLAFEFYGLTVFEASRDDVGTDTGPSECIFVVRTDQVPEEENFDPGAWSFDGQLYSGCRIGAFPAAVELSFDPTLPEELREQYPSGIALQFVLDGERLGVFLDSD